MSVPKYDVLGHLLTNIGGYVSNGACDLVQTDTDETIFGQTNIYGNTVVWAELGISDWNDHINGTNNVWVKWERTGVNKTCHVKQVITYDPTTTFSENQYKQLLKWRGDPTCGNGVIPFS